MRLFQLLLQHVPPQRIARNLVQAISNTSGGDISIYIKHFLHSIMDAVGFEYYVSMDELSTMNFHWPEQEAKYFIFDYQSSIFDLYCLLLEDTCTIMNREHLDEALIDMVNAFLNLYNSMAAPWAVHFHEPFSLINFSILRSMHKIRKNTPGSLVLDCICHQLFKNSQNGLGHPDSHETIFKGMLLILQKDFDYFSYYDENVFQFYSNCMEYEILGSRGQLFIHMTKTIDKASLTNDLTDSLFKFLTESNMIKAYCVFAEKGSTYITTSLLKFLNALLSHLPVLECFSREQVHIILGKALQKNERIRSLAVQFYITFMKKSFHDKLIMRDILDFYLLKADGIENLDDFIESLWEEFPYMTKFEPYIRILKKVHWNLETLSVTAQFTRRVYERLYKECDDNDASALRISKFLLQLPSLLSALENKWQIRGILMHIYTITDPEMAIIKIKDFPIAADKFIKYALQCLTKHDENQAVVLNTTYNMLKLMEFLNMQAEMEEFSNGVYEKYTEIMAFLPELTADHVQTLQHTLTLLSAITDTISALNEKHLFELLSDLKVKLIDSNALQELSCNHNCFVDSIAITTYSGCLNMLAIICAQITDLSTIESSLLQSHVTAFRMYLLKCLGDKNQPEITLVFAEAAIRALCDLYTVFNYKLERNVYHIIVNCVDKYVFEAPLSTDRQRQLELQRNILHCFNLMHKVVEIPIAITWKIVIHYGIADYFKTELTQLLDILYDFNSESVKTPSLFTYVVPVAIFNLFQRSENFRKFYKALNAYKTYIETKIPNATQRTMKVHIVLTMIDMIERALQAGQINNQTNRMELLSNMNIFLTDAYQNESHLIASESRRLQRHSLTRDEQDTLASFQSSLSQ